MLGSTRQIRSIDILSVVYCFVSGNLIMINL